MTTWDPFKEMEAVLDRYRPRRTLAKHEEIATADWYPSVDVAETERAFHIHAELPGVKKEDIKVNVNDGVLTLSGHRKSKSEDKKKKYHRIERSYGFLSRSIALPDDVMPEKVEASFQDGVLEVDLPKSKDEKPKQVDVKIN